MVAVTYEYEDGSVSRIERDVNGSWYLEGFQPMGPQEVVKFIARAVNGTYLVPRERANSNEFLPSGEPNPDYIEEAR